VKLKLDSAENLDEESDLNIYYQTVDGGRPQILAQQNKLGQTALMVQILPTFLPEP